MTMPESQRTPWLPLAAGRTVDEQIEDIRRNGNHGISPILRWMVLLGAGIPMPKATAANVIVLSCYLPFITPLLLRDYLELLDRLGLEYTYLEKELCCGLPMVLTTEGAERDKAIEASKEFMRMNRDSAQQKGATTLAYFCTWCAYWAKSVFPDEADHHVYYPDLIIERLEKETLRVAPTVVGYFEGCHLGNRYFAPGIDLDWGRYRQLLDRIDGLRVVDLPPKICCRDHPERIVEAAEENNLDTIVCSCISCYVVLKAVGGGRIQMRYLLEILLQSLKGE
jgi:Fe-S oxidoreductase